MMLHESVYYVLGILLVTSLQVLVLRHTLQEPAQRSTGEPQLDQVYRHRVIHAHAAGSPKPGDRTAQQWSWDDVDSEAVEERSAPYRSHKLNDENEAVSQAIKSRLGGGKHKKHHRHDIHVHLPTVPQNRSGELQC